MQNDAEKCHAEITRVLRTAAWACVVCAFTLDVNAQLGRAAAMPQENGSTAAARLISAQQGREIAATALADEVTFRGAQDCSHLVQQIYSAAGYEYPYASSFDLYSGNGNFRRVRHAQAGDLITWPGHVGIVLDPGRHRFYSLVRSGLQAEDYLGPYWRSRGRPRFYRYLVDSGSGVETAKASLPAAPSGKSSSRKGSVAKTEMRAEAEREKANDAPEEASLRSKVIAAPRPPANAPVAESIPTSILLTAEQRRPSSAETLNGISELNRAAASLLRTAEPLRVQTTVVILDELRVERVETKRSNGWVHLRIDSHVRIGGEGLDLKRRREKVRWELRRDSSGWQVVAPAEQVYIGRDDAVRVLAAQLAEMAQSEAAAQHDESVLGQEARIADLLSALLQK
jgi:hypothetical protein